MSSLLLHLGGKINIGIRTEYVIKKMSIKLTIIGPIVLVSKVRHSQMDLIRRAQILKTSKLTRGGRGHTSPDSKSTFDYWLVHERIVGPWISGDVLGF